MSLTAYEEKILKSIVVASENDPNRPEFPPSKPKFPATPTYLISVPGFTDVWLKDESVNPTGTHKDRMAWEIVVTYRDFLLAKKRGRLKGDLPHMSLISSGSAAIAIQTMLNTYTLPALKVLVSDDMPTKTITELKNLGCDVHITDLNKKAFKWEEILSLTQNPEGIDVTSDQSLGPTTRFYDWMSYEIINNSPDYCFVPFGTGHLYENILNVNKKEMESGKHDPRFSGDVQTLRTCNFMGATTTNPKSKAAMLYSPHLPFAHFSRQWIVSYKMAGYCGSKSDVYAVDERYFKQAMQLAHEQNIACDESGIAGLALMLQMSPKLPKDKKMLIVNTGKAKS